MKETSLFCLLEMNHAQVLYFSDLGIWAFWNYEIEAGALEKSGYRELENQAEDSEFDVVGNREPSRPLVKA